MDLSIVIVNWNVKDLLRACLESIATDFSHEIIVVDSASSDDSAEMIRQEFPHIGLIASQENLGYAKGNNLGTAIAQGRYLLLLNPDTIVKPNTLEAMISYMDDHPKVGAIGPQLLWPNGDSQSSRRRFPTLGSLFWESTLLGQWFPNNHYAQKYYMADQPAEQTHQVDWVVGAAILIRRETWLETGFIDQNFFMYFEETDWCKRCTEKGWQIHYLPTAQIVHYEGKSSEQALTARTLRFQKSKLYYTHKYFGSRWMKILRQFLKLTFTLQLTEETVKWLLRHKSDLRWNRMEAYSRLIRKI
ncbi:glycosyltransferase family 2 protein [Anaerolineales bacterium HSG6]|nr:glycosyltransferase family 2 protein [Anaerolineales bacterium HSG6]